MLSIFLFLATVGLVVGGVLGDPDSMGGFLGGAAFCYILYLIEACCSRTNTYTRNIESAKAIRAVINDAKIGRPIITFHI